VADPIFWLGLSVLLVAVSIAAVLMAMLPALKELSRAARSAEKLFDTLNRELPPTLESIRLTGMEITDLTDEVSQGVQSAGRVVQQVDQSIVGVKQQAKKAQRATRGLVVGFKAAWRSFTQPAPRRRSVSSLPPGSPDYLSSGNPSGYEEFEGSDYLETYQEETVEYWEEPAPNLGGEPNVFEAEPPPSPLNSQERLSSSPRYEKPIEPIPPAEKGDVPTVRPLPRDSA
jgi:hypothetical protein